MTDRPRRGFEAVRRASSAAWALALVVLAACPEGPPVHSALHLHGPHADGAPAAPEPAAAPPEDPALAEEMHERFAWVSAIQEVTIQGDVAEARSLAQEFSDRLPAPDQPAPAAWRPHVEALRGELEGLEHADDLRDAGTSVARLALLCGRCHADVGAHLELPEMPQPTQSDSVFKDAMHGHQWAVDRMWEGLVGPSDERWIRGSTMFVAIPGCKVAGDTGDAEERALCNHAQSLARRGMVTESREGRAMIYGRLLATCAGCHARGGPASAAPAR